MTRALHVLAYEPVNDQVAIMVPPPVAAVLTNVGDDTAPAGPGPLATGDTDDPLAALEIGWAADRLSKRLDAAGQVGRQALLEFHHGPAGSMVALLSPEQVAALSGWANRAYVASAPAQATFGQGQDAFDDDALAALLGQAPVDPDPGPQIDPDRAILLMFACDLATVALELAS